MCRCCDHKVFLKKRIFFLKKLTKKNSQGGTFSNANVNGGGFTRGTCNVPVPTSVDTQTFGTTNDLWGLTWTIAQLSNLQVWTQFESGSLVATFHVDSVCLAISYTSNFFKLIELIFFQKNLGPVSNISIFQKKYIKIHFRNCFCLTTNQTTF